MKFLKRLTVVFLILGFLIWLYTNSLLGVKMTSKDYYAELKEALVSQGYQDNMFVLSGRRWQADNWFLTKFGGAVSQSRHLKGEAIDVIILDVNADGTADAKDVDIVFNILDQDIIGNKGGIGTYKNNSDFFSQQMVHFDCRGKRARWHR
ncbi:MAG: hypothetical protein AB8F95_17145 [Bacteroidia bacterium]